MVDRSRMMANSACKRKYTVLIVEDEPMTLKVLKSFFEDGGFNVLTAGDGLETVAVYEQKKDEIDVILSDIALPKMDGWAVYSRLKAVNADVKMIFTSGFADADLEARCEREGILELIPKPYKLDEVVRIVRARVSLMP